MARSRLLRFKQTMRRMTQAVRFGIFAEPGPISDHWGYDRGTPLDRYYIEKFLAHHRADIRGAVLEVKDRGYTERFGSGVTRADVIDIDDRNPCLTIVADLAACDHLPADQFDCFVCTQTLQFIFEAKSAVASMYRLLKPGGTLLLTVPSVSRVIERDGVPIDFWRFTYASCSRLFGDQFGPENIEVGSFGNPMSGAAFLFGLSMEEVPRSKLDENNHVFPVICTVRAVKRPPIKNEIPT